MLVGSYSLFLTTTLAASSRISYPVKTSKNLPNNVFLPSYYSCCYGPPSKSSWLKHVVALLPCFWPTMTQWFSCPNTFECQRAKVWYAMRYLRNRQIVWKYWYWSNCNAPATIALLRQKCHRSASGPCSQAVLDREGSRQCKGRFSYHLYCHRNLQHRCAIRHTTHHRN